MKLKLATTALVSILSFSALSADVIECTIGIFQQGSIVDHKQVSVEIDGRILSNNTLGNLKENEAGDNTTLRIASDKDDTITYSLSTKLGGFTMLVTDHESGHIAVTEVEGSNKSAVVRLNKYYKNNQGEDVFRLLDLNCNVAPKN